LAAALASKSRFEGFAGAALASRKQFGHFAAAALGRIFFLQNAAAALKAGKGNFGGI
jgi:hypothetical protein